MGIKKNKWHTEVGDLYEGFIYTGHPTQNICISVGGRDTGERDEKGRRIFESAGMMITEGEAARLPDEAHYEDLAEEVIVLFDRDDESIFPKARPNNYADEDLQTVTSTRKRSKRAAFKA